MAELKYEIVQHLATLAEGSKGWSKELNLVSWNDRDPKFDLREWAPDHTKMGKGGQGHVPAHAVTAIKKKMLHLILTPS